MKFKRGDEVKITDNEGKPMDAVYMGLNRDFEGIRVHWVRFFKEGEKVARGGVTRPSRAKRKEFITLKKAGWHDWYILESRFLSKEGL